MALPPSKRKDKALSNLVEDIDLDVTPIMNILVILIPFLVSMAVFTQIATINFSLPPTIEGNEAEEEEKNNDEEKPLDITIAITDKGFILTGTNQVMPPILKKGGKYDLKTLDKLLRAIKLRYPKQEDIVLLVEQAVFYEDIIQVMDLCRDAHYPNIGLSGGFI